MIGGRSAGFVGKFRPRRRRTGHGKGSAMIAGRASGVKREGRERGGLSRRFVGKVRGDGKRLGAERGVVIS